jgi:hypothetical protein
LTVEAYVDPGADSRAMILAFNGIYSDIL